MTDPAATAMHRTFALLEPLLGTWHGRGRGQFPTIDAFEFREETRFTRRSEAECSLMYEQRTWELGSEGEEPSHWETGFFVVNELGELEVFNAQLNRVEVLVGTVQLDGVSTQIDVESRLHGFDARMVSARRLLVFEEDSLRYEVHMATDQVAAPRLHLQAGLARA